MDPAVGPTGYLCKRCGFDLSGSALGGTCPECGMSVRESLQKSGSRAPLPGAVPCLIVGILSLTVCGLLGPIAIAQYYDVKRKASTGLYDTANMGMATAGLVTGMISTLLVVGGCLIWALMISLA